MGNFFLSKLVLQICAIKTILCGTPAMSKFSARIGSQGNKSWGKYRTENIPHQGYRDRTYCDDINLHPFLLSNITRFQTRYNWGVGLFFFSIVPCLPGEQPMVVQCSTIKGVQGHFLPLSYILALKIKDPHVL